MGKTTRLTQEQWVERSKKAHNGFYDYSNTIYVNSKTPVVIKCPEHGYFTQNNPFAHMQGTTSCKGCITNIRREIHSKTNSEFLEKAKKVHDTDFFIYITNYENSNQKMIMECQWCGNIFSQTPEGHLSGKGCKKCWDKIFASLRSKTTEKFIEESKLIHGEKYDYTNTIYVNAKTPVNIKCKKCGNVFSMIPRCHSIRGQGCKECAKNKIIDIDLKSEYPDGTNYREEYLKLIQKAKENFVSEQSELHHILPKSMFPNWENRKSNLVNLSIQDHYRAHYLLFKIYNNFKMAVAFKCMLDVTGKEYNPELYEEAKSKLVEKIGKKVYCFETKEIFNSIALAARKNSVTSSRISEACKNWKSKSSNKHWCYLEDKEEAINFWTNDLLLNNS